MLVSSNLELQVGEQQSFLKIGCLRNYTTFIYGHMCIILLDNFNVKEIAMF